MDQRRETQAGEKEVASVAEKLGREARRRAESNTMPTPWAVEVERHVNGDGFGGSTKLSTVH